MLLGMMTNVQKHLLTNGVLTIDACGFSSELRGRDLPSNNSVVRFIMQIFELT